MNLRVRYVPERRLAVLVALCAPLWLLPGAAGRAVAVGALVMVGVLAAIDLLRLPAPSAFGMSRRIEDSHGIGASGEDGEPLSIGVGDEEPFVLELRNASLRPVQVRLRDRVPAIVAGGVGDVDVHVGAGTIARLDGTITGVARGRAPLGDVGLRYRTALGLVGARHTLASEQPIAVVPSMRGVRRFRLLAMQHHLASMGVRALRRKGEGQGFAGLREYALGDDPRHVDWKTTAKKGKLITREFTIERSQTVIALVDAGRGMTAIAGTLPRFEHALNSALVLADVAAGSGDRVGALVFDDAVRAWVAPRQSRGALEAIRQAVVPVAATSVEPDYASAFRFLATQQRKRALIVFYTDVIDTRASAAVLAYVARSAARHLVLVVALRNDSVFAAATPHEGDGALALYARAAAEELVQAREAALERMRRAGVVVLDLSPETMTAAVINRYLELKARGAL